MKIFLVSHQVEIETKNFYFRGLVYVSAKVLHSTTNYVMYVMSGLEYIADYSFCKL